MSSGKISKTHEKSKARTLAARDKAMGKQPSKDQGFVFTINNYAERKLEVPRFSARTMKYLVWVPQEGGKNKTPHWQGFVQFKCGQTKVTAAKQLGYTMKEIGYINYQRGTAKEASDYVEEDEKETNTGAVVKQGEIDHDIAGRKEKEEGGQGKRTDFQKFLDAVNEGTKARQLRIEFPSLHARYPAWCDKELGLKESDEWKEPTYPLVFPWGVLNRPDPAEKDRHMWVVGPPDSGKTFAFQKTCKGLQVFMAGPSERYRFENYAGEDIICFDDVMPKLNEILDCTGTWDIKKERAGGKRYNPGFWPMGHTRTVVVLSNEEPKMEGEHKWPASFWARFKVVHYRPERKSFGIRGGQRAEAESNQPGAAAPKETKEEFIARQKEEMETWGRVLEEGERKRAPLKKDAVIDLTDKDDEMAREPMTKTTAVHDWVAETAPTQEVEYYETPEE